MKLLAGLLLIALTFTGCEKMYPGGCVDEKTPLTGKWSYVEQFTSDGGPGKWSPVPGGQAIEFRRDGGFVGTGNFYREAKRYEMLGLDRVKVYPASTASGYVILNYNLSGSNNALQLSPVEPMCIEGCASKFVRK